MMNDNLREQLLEIYFERDNLWNKSKPVLDYDHCACMCIITEPKEAQNINEVTSFTVSSEISGFEKTNYTRKYR